MPLDNLSPDAASHIGSDIRAWRQAHNLTQRAAADALHVSHSNLRGWEAGRPCQCAALLRAYMGLRDKWDALTGTTVAELRPNRTR